MEKEELRRQMRAMRRALSPQEQTAAAHAVFAQLGAFAPYRAAKCVMAYMACRGELSLEPVMRDALDAGKTLLLPRCEAPGVMTARKVNSLSQLQSGMYGLLEPEDACAVFPPEEIELILVPGTAFDRAGGRIGQGGGYYDRFLGQTRALRVGVCHSFALLERVPAQAHDQRMDFIVTPGGIICAGEDRREATNDHRRT